MDPTQRREVRKHLDHQNPIQRPKTISDPIETPFINRWMRCYARRSEFNIPNQISEVKTKKRTPDTPQFPAPAPTQHFLNHVGVLIGFINYTKPNFDCRSDACTSPHSGQYNQVREEFIYGWTLRRRRSISRRSRFCWFRFARFSSSACG